MRARVDLDHFIGPRRHGHVTINADQKSKTLDHLIEGMLNFHNILNWDKTNFLVEWFVLVSGPVCPPSFNLLQVF